MKKKLYLKNKKIREIINSNKGKDAEKNFFELLKRAAAPRNS
jgi:hypothetical protein